MHTRSADDQGPSRKQRRAEEPLEPLTPSPYASVVYLVPRPVKGWPRATRLPGRPVRPGREVIRGNSRSLGYLSPRWLFRPPGPCGRSGPERNLATGPEGVNAIRFFALQRATSNNAGRRHVPSKQERVTTIDVL